MREVRTVQMSIFELYSEHEIGKHLEKLSSLIDSFPVFLELLEQDLIDCSGSNAGRKGLSVESILRCLVLKQMLQVSYQQLSFLLSDSLSYSTFARVDLDKAPSRSTLQATIRSIRPETIEAISNTLVQKGFEDGTLSLKQIRIDSTVVADGGYASLSNVEKTKELGAKRVVFHKKKGITLTAMGVKQKTYKALKNFRAGIEGNISELKRAFGFNKALWKTHDGFKAYVWSSVLSYNLNRLARMQVDLTG